MSEADEVADRFRAFSHDADGRLPLYARLTEVIADDPALHRLLLEAPSTQRLPVLFLASVHYLVLSAPGSELARFYPNVSGTPDDGDPGPALKRFCAEHEMQLRSIMATRTTQTNEVGRCAVLLPVLGLLAAEVGPLGLLDVGTSAGLNLAIDAYRYEYRPGGGVGPDSPVVLRCDTRGGVPVPREMPVIAARLGLDRSPIDIADADSARWLQACVWPEQPARFARLRDAIVVVRRRAPAVRRADAVAGLACGVAEVGSEAHPVVTNTWVLNYLTSAGRRAYLDTLATLGAGRDVSWIYAESPHDVGPELPVPDGEVGAGRTVVTLVRWRSGRRSVEHLAGCHAHGRWLYWY